MPWRDHASGRRWRRDASNAAWVLEEVYAATADPAATDDAGDGFAAGSRWINTAAGRVFVCADPTEGAAVWQPAGPAASRAKAPPEIANNATDASNDIDIAAGACLADEGVPITLAAAISKRLDAAWAAGTGEGGLDTGSKATRRLVLGLADRQGRRHRRRAVLAGSHGAGDAQRLRLQAAARLGPDRRLGQHPRLPPGRRPVLLEGAAPGRRRRDAVRHRRAADAERAAGLGRARRGARLARLGRPLRAVLLARRPGHRRLGHRPQRPLPVERRRPDGGAGDPGRRARAASATAPTPLRRRSPS